MCCKFVLLFCAQCSHYGHSGARRSPASELARQLLFLTGLMDPRNPFQSCSYKANSHPYSPSFWSVSGFFEKNPESACAEAWDLVPTLVRCCTCLFLAGNTSDYFTDNVAQSGENISTRPCFPSSFNGGTAKANPT